MTAKVVYCDECGEPIALPDVEPDSGEFSAESTVSLILDHYAEEHPDHPSINHPPSGRSGPER